jgi:CheY-like chemotaxis protein
MQSEKHYANTSGWKAAVLVATDGIPSAESFFKDNAAPCITRQLITRTASAGMAEGAPFMAPGKHVWLRSNSDIENDNLRRERVQPETKSVTSVLIIDDGELDTYISKNTIKRVLSNVSITACGNGLEAIHRLKRLLRSDLECLPDYIFLDLSMPVMDGFQFLEEYRLLKIDKVRKKIKVYVLSSALFTPDLEKALSSSIISGFISKPIDSKKVKEIFNVD